MPKTVLLTGSTGFIGEHLAQYLIEAGFAISFFDRLLEVEEQFGDGIDTVIHLAARAHILKEQIKEPLLEFRKANVELSVKLAKESLKNNVKRFIFISSIGVLGNRTLEKRFNEKCPYAPVEDYAISKMEAELELKKVFENKDTELVIIRPPLVYGTGVKGNFKRLVNLVQHNKFLPLACISGVRSYVSVYNLCDLIITCIDHPKAPGEIFLAGDDDDISTKDLFGKIADILDKRCILLPFPRNLLLIIAGIFNKSREVNRLLDSLVVDISYTIKTLEWTPPYTFEEGLKKTIENETHI